MKHHPQTGASLIEVLVAILILSFGMLSLGTMLSYSVQAPKLAGYRATAANLASSYIERMRANRTGFESASYDKKTHENSLEELVLDPTKICAYPNCNSARLATMDMEETKVAVRSELPAGDIIMSRDESIAGADSIANSVGNLWIIWQEPKTSASAIASDDFVSDNCPIQVDTTTDPKPRCLYVRFKI